MALLQVKEIRDEYGNIVPNAIVIAICEDDFSEIEHTPEGQDAPSGFRAYVNRSDNVGRCNIEVPDGDLRFAVAYFHEDPSKGSAIKVHV